MPTKNIYVPKEAEQIFERAKELAGDSISSVIIRALEDYIRKKENEEQGFDEIVLWRGYEEFVFGTVEGNYVRFVGRWIGEHVRQSDNDTVEKVVFYVSKNGKYVVNRITEVPNVRSHSDITEYKDIEEVLSAGYRAILAIDKKMRLRQAPPEELDV